MKAKIGRSSSRKQYRIGGGLARFGAVSLVVVMLAMALMPLTSTGVSAANSDDLTIDSNLIQVTPNLQDDTVADDINPALIDNVNLPADDVVLDPPIAVGTIQINKLGCTDDYSGDYYQLAANCAPMDAPFTVSSSGGDVSFGGSFTAENVIVGAVTVTETVPVGYGDPIVFCDSYDASGAESGFWQANAPGGSLGYDLQPGEFLYCDWFNVPSQGDGSIYINKHLCPVDYDASAKDYYDLAADCSGTQDGVTFGLTLDDAPVAEQVTGNAIPSAVNFEGLFPSTYGAHETLPAGYHEPVVYCNRNSLLDATSLEVYLATTVNGSTDLTLNQGEYLFCDWFNIPSTDGTVTIHKWECPENLAFVVAPTREDMLGACTATMNGVTFDLSYPDDAGLTGETRTTGDDGDGTVVFNGVQPGNIEVTEQIPSGYGDPYVFCGFGAINDEDGDGVAIAIDGLIPGQILPGGVLAHKMVTSESLYCDWFNRPSSGGDVTIYKWECPKGYDAYSASYDELVQNCTQPMSGIDFTLDNVSGGADELVGIENTDASGKAGFSDLDSGEYSLTEAMPTGYGYPVVFCQKLEGDAQSMPVSEVASINLELESNSRIICQWFNVPTDDGTITIYKYTCAPGYDLTAPGADPKVDCTEKTNGITFTLSGDGIADLQTSTGDSIPGAVTWGGLQPGDYNVAEQVPDGTVATFVICQWEEATGPFRYETYEPYTVGDYAVGNRIDLKLIAGTAIVCSWYNVPEDTHGGDLIVIKYWCDGNIYDEAHCQLYGGGADFTLEAADGTGDPIAFTTGGDGTAQLYLYPGAYTLTETGRQWCKAKSDQVDGDGNILVYDQQTSYVTVFNCGPGKKHEPPVKKFPNTGVGNLTSGNGTDGFGTYGLLLSIGLVAVAVGLRMARPQMAKVIARVEHDPAA